MKQYLDLLQKTVDTGIPKPNRTGTDTIGIIGGHMQFNLQDGFPMVTSKQVFWKKAIAEMLGFLRGYTNAADFRSLGCNVWDANANENEEWLASEYRQGDDDLGVIYGAQARKWTGGIDQLANAYNDLKMGIDNRREIVTHWNPSVMKHMTTKYGIDQYHNSQMALPPCHLLYQFGIQGDELHLSMYQRSCDMGLGVPFNIIGYSWLLQVMAQITGLKVGTFNHFLHDVHVYVNHLDQIGTMLTKEPLPLPRLHINQDIKTLRDLETWVTMDDFMVTDYQHHGYLKMEMAI